MTTEDILSNAIELIKTGKKAEAQKMLEPYIEVNLQDVTAWLWEAETWPSLEKKIKVLEMCLTHNPDNQQARQVLAALKAQKAGANLVNIEDKSVKSRKKWRVSVSPNTWFGRLRIILGTIIAAMFIAGLHAPIVFFAPIFWLLFPAGLNFRSHDLYGADYEAALHFGWLFYAGITVLATLTRNRKFFFVIYIILSFVLILNVRGCMDTSIGPQ